jgi:hypothetical protein
LEVLRLLNWTTGEGTAKYWTSKLLIETADIDHDRAVLTKTSDVKGEFIFSQAFVGRNNRRWILIVNKRFRRGRHVFVAGATGGRMLIVNEETGFGPAKEVQLESNQIKLSPYAVAVIHMPTSANVNNN